MWTKQTEHYSAENFREGREEIKLTNKLEAESKNIKKRKVA